MFTVLISTGDVFGAAADVFTLAFLVILSMLVLILKFFFIDSAKDIVSNFAPFQLLDPPVKPVR